MQKVTIQQDIITPYRIPVFNKLAEKYDLTVTYVRGERPQNVQFKTLKLNPYRIPKVGMLYGHKFINAIRNSDVLVAAFPTPSIEVNTLKCWNSKTKLIQWGIGVPADYCTRYDEANASLSTFLRALKKADAAVFYSEYPKIKYIKMGFSAEKMFVANNTVEIDTDFSSSKNYEKVNLLFVGSLYKQKKIEILLESYAAAYQVNHNIPSLTIIGDGELRESIQTWVCEKKLNQKITLTGAIFDEHELAKYFKNSILCISPDQAGLSVLKSMGYGVPYVTHKDAITGGERFNIHNGEDGILIDDFTELKNIILDVASNRDVYLKMGQNAQKYYLTSRTINQMVQGFVDAIQYVTLG